MSLLGSPLVKLIKTVGVVGAILVLFYSCSSLRTETYLSEGTSPRGFDEYCTEWTIEFFGGERQVRKNCHAVDPKLAPDLSLQEGLSDPLGRTDSEAEYTEWDTLYSEQAPPPQ